MNICTNSECGKEYTRVQGQKKSSKLCKECLDNARVAKDENRNRKQVICKCGRDAFETDMINHDGIPRCPACDVLIKARQDRWLTIDKFAEGLNMHSSGLGDCSCSVGGGR
ncbi:hypothetical protein KAR91_53530 [Candidatus Pacearchaeota archaeon]|nr:hypothetical protein [Candidatus Pacearchaeota archaeon]